MDRFPLPLPDGTAVPAWAYLDVVSGDEFSVANAKSFAAQQHSDSVAGGPTATISASGPAPSSSAAATSASTSTTSAGGTPTHSAAPDSDKPKSNAGPIAGGVIGGVALIAACILGWLWWRRRQHVQHAVQNEQMDTLMTGTSPTLASHAFTPSPGPPKLYVSICFMNICG